ncbi:thioesterase family protein [uncultured Thalassolituus sp.]|uniref:acyl-CoA thioesterase n=1 Tax=uncultured Thalassolituus sp. TaxID=285273 RepID=UPI002638B245|nr:thioesterase family protein [uncultured Thalassolituus sp.]
MKPFNHYNELVRTGEPVALDASWGQGKTTFGGMSAALALAAIERDHPQDAPLRSISVHFCGPLATDAEFTTSTRVLRAGRSISHISAEIHQNDACATSITACYGTPRESDVQVLAADVAPGEPGAGQRLPYIAGMTPEFVRHIDFSYVSGGLPFSGSKDNHIHGWMRFSDCTSDLTSVHLVALIDAWPPTTLQKLRKVAPCASVTWSLELVASPESLDTPLGGDEWLWYEAQIEEAHGGYAHTTARIYRADGLLLALSRQLVTVYDKR